MSRKYQAENLISKIQRNFEKPLKFILDRLSRLNQLYLYSMYGSAVFRSRSVFHVCSSISYLLSILVEINHFSASILKSWNTSARKFWQKKGSEKFWENEAGGKYSRNRRSSFCRRESTEQCGLQRPRYGCFLPAKWRMGQARFSTQFWIYLGNVETSWTPQVEIKSSTTGLRKECRANSPACVRSTAQWDAARCRYRVLSTIGATKSARSLSFTIIWTNIWITRYKNLIFLFFLNRFSTKCECLGTRKGSVDCKEINSGCWDAHTQNKYPLNSEFEQTRTDDNLERVWHTRPSVAVLT